MAEPGLQGKVALVTGGTRGIGRAAALALADAGAAVWVGAREAHEPGHAIRYTPLDVRSSASVQACFDRVAATLGRLDVLVNCAGIGLHGPLGEADDASWRAVIETNLSGVFSCCRAALPLLQRAGGGRIVNIGSVVDSLVAPGNTVYSASKFGVRGLSLNLAAELAPLGIGVTLISPGATDTEMTRKMGFAVTDMLRVEDVASTIRFVAESPLAMRIDEIRLLPPKGLLP